MKNPLVSILIFFLSLSLATKLLGNEARFILLNKNDYKNIFKRSREEISELLHTLKTMKDSNVKIQHIASQFGNRPYLYEGAMGEGDWQSNSYTYAPDALHMQQDPVYRVDGFDCQTLVQMIIALIHADNIVEFDQTYLRVAYGGANNPQGGIVRYKNRNHFVDADLNRVNQINHFFLDVTSHGPLSRYTATTSAVIDKNHWFQHNMMHRRMIRVFDRNTAHFITKKVKEDKLTDGFDNFKKAVVLSYIPKTFLFLTDGKFNPSVFTKLKLPVVLEFAYDAHAWRIGGSSLKEAIGTELNIGHFGILYQQTFKAGEIIYHKISCKKMSSYRQQCVTESVTCKQPLCPKLMFVHATNRYSAQCRIAAKTTPPVSCNRVEVLPLEEYFESLKNNAIWSYNSPVFLGVHIEKLLS